MDGSMSAPASIRLASARLQNWTRSLSGRWRHECTTGLCSMTLELDASAEHPLWISFYNVCELEALSPFVYFDHPDDGFNAAAEERAYLVIGGARHRVCVSGQSLQVALTKTEARDLAAVASAVRRLQRAWRRRRCHKHRAAVLWVAKEVIGPGNRLDGSCLRAMGL